jgi:hypothetical protein
MNRFFLLTVLLCGSFCSCAKKEIPIAHFGSGPSGEEADEDDDDDDERTFI